MRGRLDPLDRRQGPAAPAPHEGQGTAKPGRLQANYRYHIQLSAADLGHIQALWRSLGEKAKPASGVESAVDVEPLSFR